MKRSYISLAIIGLLIALALWANLPGNTGIKIGDFQRSMQLIQGLDLRGGVQVLLEADLPDTQSIDPQALEDARRILENRTNALGVSENLFQVAGQNRIVGEFPGLTDPEEILGTIRETGLLEFVDLGANPENLDTGMTVQTDFGMDTASPPSDAQPTETMTATESPAEEAPSSEPTPAGKVYPTLMTGTALKSVGVTTNPNSGQYELYFELKPESTKIFADYTTANVGKILAIVLDKRILSAPVINSPITMGQGSITGKFTYEEANNLAIQMRYGALPIPFKVVESRVIGPTLGEDSLRKSLTAGLVGFAIVMLFMAIYYRVPGILADFEILVYGSLLLTLFRLLPVTLTLPGIAGFLLSTGSALDANILIFERFKEEIRAGRTFSQATDLAWKRAWPSIRDSNIATIITCVILYLFGSSFGATIVKGFAITLGLGVVISIFCAFLVTMTLFKLVVAWFNPTNQHRKLFGIVD